MKKRLSGASALNRILDVRWLYSFLGLILIFLVSSQLSSSFLTAGNMLTILRQASILLMLSLGLTAVVLTGNIDLSVNSCAALTGCICAKMLVGNVPAVWAILISMLVGIVSGLFNGFLVGVLRLPSFIATYGTNMVLSGLATIVMNGGVIYDLPSGFRNLGVGYLGPFPFPSSSSRWLPSCWCCCCKRRSSAEKSICTATTTRQASIPAPTICAF